MNRRQLAFVILLNAFVSLVMAVLVVWIVELRRPDPEALAAVFTPAAAPIALTFTPTPFSAPASDTNAQPQATPAAPSEPVTPDQAEYTVQAGDSLSSIADRFGLTLAELVAANKLTNPDFVFEGQRLVIPTGGVAAAPATAAPPAIPVGLRISAFSQAGQLAGEAVGIVNDSDLAVNLQGWRLEKEGGPAYSFGNVLLFPGSGVQLFSGAGTDTSVAVYWNQAAPVWAPGVNARLINAQGAEVARLVVQ
ncbi:MAG: LysM peptidoglycan-binding domain-containing protein [Anaerolineales bacterium]|nr:LysM peptidoglycan-binding domain-containing protein [Anaerolineales bacterium]